MCSILMNKAALQAFGVAPEQGLLLAKRCGVTTNASACAKSTAGAGKVQPLQVVLLRLQHPWAPLLLQWPSQQQAEARRIT